VAVDGEADGAAVGGDPCPRLGNGSCVCRENYETLNLAPDRFQMKDFSNASFPPETIAIMKVALDRAVASLPDPVSSAHVQAIAETILRTAKDGERDPAILQRMALMELQILTRC
jgi:hypothetical protein